jgi:hypothetical protein
MKSDRSPQISLIVVWPLSVPAPAARQATRRLVEARVRCTWALDQASQVESLASWGAIRAGADAALRAADGQELLGDGGSGELARRLEIVRATGLRVDVVLAGAAMAAGQWPRMLRALGVHGLVVDGVRPEGVTRALPFGVWQFSPHSAAPRARGWASWLRGRRPLLAPAAKGPSVITLDLARVGAAGSRAWRDVESTIEEVLVAITRGAATPATVSELAAQLTQANSPRPQRSILRTAA